MSSTFNYGQIIGWIGFFSFGHATILENEKTVFKSTAFWRILAVTHIPVKDFQITPLGKTRQE